jgi:hypothetical protein
MKNEYPWLKQIYKGLPPSELRALSLSEKADRLRRAVLDHWKKYGIETDETIIGILSLLDFEDAIQYLEATFPDEAR